MMRQSDRSAPIQIVIFGGSGDLSQKKLLPALFDLYQKNLLPEQFHILGLARSQRTQADYHALVRGAIETHVPDASSTDLTKFCAHVTYVAGTFADPATYDHLTNHLRQQEQDWAEKGNCLFYLAVPPQYYADIFTNVHRIIQPEKGGDHWARLLVEKPFGKDLDTAQVLEQQLSTQFSEDQIYRIDHYLAKEAVQNILAFRFSNTLFTAPWNNDAIESVHISMYETGLIEDRGELYDGLGALRDVGQNHLLQLLALTAMRCPETLAAADISAKRAEVLRSLRPLPLDDDNPQVVRGQYEGFTDNPGVDTDSETETYFQMKVQLDMPEWEGIPFYLTAGKGLHENHVGVRVKFKMATYGPYQDTDGALAGNEVHLAISPKQEMSVTVNAKAPGLALTLEQRVLHFTCHAPGTEITNSYEKILIDCIYGDKTLFTSTEEVLAAWQFISPILARWNHVPLQSYSVGSQGPRNTLL